VDSPNNRGIKRTLFMDPSHFLVVRRFSIRPYGVHNQDGRMAKFWEIFL